MVYFLKKLKPGNKKLSESFFETLVTLNRLNYDYLYIEGEAFSDEDKENFFHNMIEISAVSEIPVIVSFPITHFEDMKKLYYANTKLIVASKKTNVEASVIEEGVKRYGNNLVVSFDDFSKKSIELDSLDELDPDYIKDGDFYIIDKSDRLEEIASLKSALSDKGFNTKALIPEIGFDELKKNDDGLVPVIVTDYKTDKLLMMAYMNEEA